MNGDHYFAESPETPSEPRLVDVLLPDVSFTLHSDSGVFSHGRLDEATRILLETAPLPPRDGALLDLGCGYGAIALTLAHRSPAATVWAVDVNDRARVLTSSNAATAGLSNVEAAEPSQIPDGLLFDAIYSNPPIRIGKPALRELLGLWLSRLAPGGTAYLVMSRHLGADSMASWLGEQGYHVIRLASRHGFRVLSVTIRSEPT